tara:strand:- start:1460 stop:2347 length:888 start_codon:yes stop_codon:yes gene_type:complete
LAKKKNEPPVGSVALSAGAVFLIFFIWPLVMGGSVALAAAFGEEVQGKTAPEDANGYQWLYPDNSIFNPTYGSCPNSPVGTTIVNNPLGVNMDNATRVVLGSSFNAAEFSCKNSDEYILRIPAGLLDQERSISELRFEWLGTQYSQNSGSVNNEYTMDIELKVNGEAIFDDDDYNFRGTRRSATTNYYHASVDFTHEFDGIELMKLRSEIDNCGSNCNITLTFSDITIINSVQFTALSNSFGDGFIRMETKTVDPDTEGLIMTVSPYVVAILTFTLALGSTRLFNPLVGFIGGRV